MFSRCQSSPVDDCVGRGCFQRDIAYRVPMRQLVALTRISKHCGQSFELQVNIFVLLRKRSSFVQMDSTERVIVPGKRRFRNNFDGGSRQLGFHEQKGAQ